MDTNAVSTQYRDRQLMLENSSQPETKVKKEPEHAIQKAEEAQKRQEVRDYDRRQRGLGNIIDVVM